MSADEYKQFDPARHPVNDVQEELASALHRASPKSNTELPDKTRIHKVSDHEFHIHNRHDHHIAEHDDHEETAKHVLDLSAKSHHSGSLGGTHSFRSFTEYKEHTLRKHHVHL